VGGPKVHGVRQPPDWGAMPPVHLLCRQCCQLVRPVHVWYEMPRILIMEDFLQMYGKGKQLEQQV